MTRSLMLQELSAEYVLAARAKGLSEARVVWRHALGNALVPLLTATALSYAYLLEGAVLTETVFAWPGIGLYVTQALFSADLPAVLGATTVIGACFVSLNALVDSLNPLLDPRISR
ncbi:ABC transporter permease [Methylobacterium pseudosasicola]|uniref:Peptide/nickel transport system permease protein n=1 Tax=Methylobacterium pseudosasicola TaxID=582667 RepID=A0A1I4UM33_9HYPH|nr:ABC transporter permease [Methylobacterium pseudosasicola]SFM90057.1 peptide/nickel transport system permease protein [Methylobacterium pseudosasicola]